MNFSLMRSVEHWYILVFGMSLGIVLFIVLGG